MRPGTGGAVGSVAVGGGAGSVAPVVSEFSLMQRSSRRRPPARIREAPEPTLIPPALDPGRASRGLGECDDGVVTAAPSRQPGAARRGRPLTRPREGRVVAGVAAGLAAHLDLPVRTVRIGLALSVLANGFGLVLYAWLWALLPGSEGVPAAEPSRSAVERARPGRR